MNKYKYIINPITKDKCKFFSIEGQILFNTYVKRYEQKGGAAAGWHGASDSDSGDSDSGSGSGDVHKKKLNLLMKH